MECKIRSRRLNPVAPTFNFPQLTNSSDIVVNDTPETQTTKKLPTLTGKHRKSNLCDHPDTEFLEMQIVTLKSSLAKKELEHNKVKQSDALKVKQINNLEAKLQVAMNTLKEKEETQQRNPENVSYQVLDQPENSSLKYQFLENKTSYLENN